MEFAPSWDLFIIVFFAVVVAYSFIIGRDQTLKIIISSYIATLAADGLGNILEHSVIKDEASFRLFSISFSDNMLAVLKISIFVLAIVLITIKGSFQINLAPEKQKAVAFFMTATYGVLSAGLLISTILVYASGASFVEGGSGMVNGALRNVYEYSSLVRLMIDGYSWWFSLPALAFVVSSFATDSE